MCAQELHEHVRIASSVIITRRRTKKPIRNEWRSGSTAGSAESIRFIKKPGNPDWVKEVTDYGKRERNCNPEIKLVYRLES